MEGFSYAEIAAVLGVPGGTAKGWVSRGRSALRLALDEKRAPGSSIGSLEAP
jgi:RNA polymerase sigma-70 factor, ECF subfamily